MSKKKRQPKRQSAAIPKPPSVVKIPLVERMHFPDVSSPQDEFYKKVFWGIALVTFLVTMILAWNSGTNGDDSFQNDYSDQLVDFYTTMGQDTSAFYHPKGPIQYYGGVYEVPVGAVNAIFGLDSKDDAYHTIRHLFNGLFGVLAMIFVGLFAQRIGGWRAGIIALVLIFLSPRFLGHSLMNPKDIPFAAGYIMALYFLARLLEELPKPSNKTLFGLAGGIGIAFGARAGGLILVPYIVMFIGLAYLLNYGVPALWKHGKQTLKYIAYGGVPIIAGLLLGILVWPYAIVDPISHIPESLSGLTKYAVNIRMLFQGEMIFGKDVPPYYLAVWIWNTVPLFIHLGLLILLVLGWQMIKKYNYLLLALALFTAFFPIVYVIIQNSTLYDGWRHLTFAYTPLVAIVAVAWHHLIKILENKKPFAYAVVGLLALTTIEPAWFIAKNADYPYIYFNPLIGGIEGAFGELETDYWGVSMQPAMEWLEDQGIVHENMQDTIIIASNFSDQLGKYFRKKYNGKVKTQYLRFRQRYDKPWDYGLFLSRYVRGSHLNQGTWPPEGKTIHTIDANGIPLVAILKEDSRNPHLGVMAGKKSDWKKVIELLEPEVLKYPQNEIAWLELARAYTNTDTIDLAYDALERVLKIEPENVQAANLLGLNYINAGRIQEGLKVFENSLTFESQNFIAHFYIASVNSHAGNLQVAMDNARQALKLNPKFKEGYILMSEILAKMGNMEEAAKYRAAAQRVGQRKK